MCRININNKQYLELVFEALNLLHHWTYKAFVIPAATVAVAAIEVYRSTDLYWRSLLRQQPEISSPLSHDYQKNYFDQVHAIKSNLFESFNFTFYRFLF